MVIDALLELIQSQAELVVCCIEALGNFNVLTEQTHAVVQCVADRLDSSPLADLPAIVKYLVQEAPSSEAVLLVGQLRDKLSSALSYAAETELAQGHQRSERNEEALILSSIAQAFLFRDDLRKTFVSLISSTKADDTPMRLLDVWVLVAGHSIPRDGVAMEKLFKKKITHGVLTRNVLLQSLQHHANALQSYFSSLLALAATLFTPPL